MSETNVSPASGLEKDFEKLLQPLREKDFDASYVRFVGNALKRTGVTAETQPRLFSQVRETLASIAPEYWRQKTQELRQRLTNRDYMAHRYVKDAVDDLRVFQSVGVEVDEFASEILNMLEEADEATIQHLKRVWLVRPFKEVEELREMVRVPAKEVTEIEPVVTVEPA